MGSITIRLVAWSIAVGSTLFVAARADAGFMHQYRLDGSLSDDFGGPDLVSAGGTLGPTRYTFGPNQGLSLSNGLSNAGVYSIELVFEFADTSGYRKILDFKDRTSDYGLYNLSNSLNFYPFATGPSGALASNTDARVVLTRDSSNLVAGYVNGIQQFSFVDTSNAGVFSANNNIIQFFKDDFATGQNEASGGSADLIRTYDTALSASQVAGLTDPVAVPEPPSLVLAGASALMCLACSWRRRKWATA